MPITRTPWQQLRSGFGTTVGDAIMATVADWGITHVFGIPGDHADGLLNGLYKHRERLRFVLVRHEENAAFMATAYAKLTGRMAAVLTTAGPGAFHLTNGLYEAYHDRVPLLALTGNTDTYHLGTDQVQEFSPEADFAGCTVWAHTLGGARNARIVTANAIRTSYSLSAPALLAVPVDLGLEAMPREAAPADHQFSRPTHAPAPEQIAQVAAALDRARRPVLLVGRGCWGLGPTLIELAAKVGAPIIKALWGKEAVSDEDPHVLGGLGLIGTRPSVEAIAGADLLLMLGTSFPFNDFLPEPGRCTLVQIDHDPRQIGKRHAVHLGVCADVQQAVPQLLARCQPHPDQGWLASCQTARGHWNALMDRQARSLRTPMRPQVMARALQAAAAPDAIICTDSGANTVWMARNFFVNGQQRFIGSGLMSTMQCGLPYAIGAAFACPGRQVIAAVGDGDFVMAMGEFLTAVAYELPIVVCIFNNGNLSLIRYEEEAAGLPEFGIRFHNPDFAKLAEACGGFGVRVEDPRDAEEAVRAALASGRPAVIDALVEPHEVPFPPKIGQGQATGFGIAFLREQFARLQERG